MDENIEKIELIKRAYDYKLSGQYNDALALLYRALQFDDYGADNVELLSQIGELHFLLGHFERALEEFDRALAIMPSHTYSLQKSYEILDKTGEYSRALGVAKKMYDAQKTPESCFCYFSALIKTGQKQQALDEFNSLEDDVKLNSDVLYLIAQISDNVKKEAILRRIVQLDAEYKPANLELAKIECEKGNWDASIKFCLNLEEDNPLALYYIAKCEAGRQNHKSAIDFFIKAIKYDNGCNDIYLDLAKVYIDILDFENALIALKKSINFSLSGGSKENLDEKYFLSGWLLMKQNEPSKALLNLGSVKENSKFYLNAQILIKTITLKNFNLAKAKTTLEEYYKRDGENPLLLDALAHIYKELKLFKDAISMYEKALEIYPSSIYYALEVIDLLIDEKRYDEAKEKIKDFCSLYPNCAQAYNSLTRIHYREKNLQEALSSIEKCLELDNKNPEFYYFKGLILNDLERYDEAKTTLYSAIKYNPQIAKYYSQMARSYFGIKEFENALLYSKEAIEINPADINYKKQAYEIALSIGDEKRIALYKNQLKRSEQILKMER